MSTALLTSPKDEVEDFVLDERFEIVDGIRVVMPPMSAPSSVLAYRLARRIGNYAEPMNLGEAFTEILFKLPLPVDRNRRPDIAFVSYDRWPKNRPIPQGSAWNVVPDFCVEVVSPTDLIEETRAKVEEYFEAGVRLIWVVYPQKELVDVYDSRDRMRVVRREGTLDGGDVIPGFSLPLAELFPEC
jgi:Uma2 family endonuclease